MLRFLRDNGLLTFFVGMFVLGQVVGWVEEKLEQKKR